MIENSKTTAVSFPRPLRLSEALPVLTANLNTFRNEWSSYAAANGVSDMPSELQTGTLLAALGADCAKVYHDLEVTLSSNDRRNADVLLACITRHLLGDDMRQRRVNFAKQLRYDGEPFWRFLKRLELHIEGCQYGALRDDVLLDKIIASIKNDAISLELCSTPGVTLAMAKERCYLEDKNNNRGDGTDERKTHPQQKKTKNKTRKQPQEQTTTTKKTNHPNYGIQPKT